MRLTEPGRPRSAPPWENADCPAVPGDRADTARVIGFPREKTDTAQQGQMRVGELISLYLVLLGRGQFGQDTSRVVNWSVADHSPVSLTGVSDGSATLTATAPGIVEDVLVNGSPFPIWSCDRLTCTKLKALIVTP